MNTKISFDNSTGILSIKGILIVKDILPMTHVISKIIGNIKEVNLQHIEKADISCLWFIYQLRVRHKIPLINTPPKIKSLFSFLEVSSHSLPSSPEKENFFTHTLYKLGKSSINLFQFVHLFINFLGAIVYTSFYSLRFPRTFPFQPLHFHIYQIGVAAIPIITLISFVIGAVLSYEGAAQLGKFGAKIYTIDLLSYSMLREIGILLTSIVVAGRTASAFAASIGTMKLNQEIEAFQILGLRPLQILVLPRLAALIICLPILAFLSDIVGLLSGALVCSELLDITYLQFFKHLRSVTTPTIFWTGLAKAPLFACIIGIVGCLHGFMVSNNAESIGKRTTTAVVQSIFLVIVLNGLIAVCLSKIGI